VNERIHARAGSISPSRISIFTNISEPKISAISISIPIFFTAALFSLLTLEDVEKVPKFFAFHAGKQTTSSLSSTMPTLLHFQS